jgi:2-keto-4-pentenoate hydratase/2-oxohepta-3-ene-1,7-dioic acid hydratase in catechol pathway
MRLATTRTPSGEQLIVIDSSEQVAFIPSAPLPQSMRDVIDRHDSALPALREWIETAPPAVPLDSLTLSAPIADPSKIIAVGLNYVDHVDEAALELPDEPVVFAKFPSSIVGPDEAITWTTAQTSGVDYEAELAVIIGSRAKSVSKESALDYVFGYTCLNDVSARDLQFADGQWVRGKSLDTFCPIGPWIVTADEIPDPQNLAISCTVSGEILQSASTKDMHFTVAHIVSVLSKYFALEPGDIIATGTPSGVGWFREPQRLLRDGDVVVVTIENVGALSNVCRCEDNA